MNTMVERELYTKSKTAPTEEEREKARQEYLGKRKIDCLVAVGDQARYLAEGAQSAGMTAVYPCADKKAARELLPGLIRPDSTILVKASRGMRMEELVDQLLELTPEQ